MSLGTYPLATRPLALGAGESAAPPDAVSGALSASLANASLAASGQIIHVGSFSSALNSFTIVSSGNVGVSPSGSMGASLANASLAMAGKVDDRGAFASTLAGFGMAASGSAAPHAVGSFAAQLDGAGMYFSGYEGAEAPAPDVRHHRWRILRRHFEQEPH